MKRWSKLQKQLYLIIDGKIDLQIHCSIYRMNSQRGSTDLPRYWITLNKEIVFDYPQNAISKEGYPYITEISDISKLFREYLDTPKDQLLLKSFDNDTYGLTNIIKAADKRLGIKSLELYFNENLSSNKDVCMKILTARI